MTSYLYLLVEHDAPAFKIGISKNPLIRSYQLANTIDLSRSVQFLFDGPQAAAAEKVLHFLFRAHRLDRLKSDGYTEWFDISCHEQVLAFLRSMRAEIGWQTETPVGEALNTRTPSTTGLTALFAAAGRTLFGSAWQSDMARLLGMKLRSVQYIAAAARDGGEYRIQPHRFAEIAGHLDAKANDLDALSAVLSARAIKPKA